MPTDPFADISSSNVAAWAGSLRSGGLSGGVTVAGLRAAAPLAPASTTAYLVSLSDQGWAPKQIAFLLEQIVLARESRPRASHLLDLVLSGPEVEGVPTRRTGAVYRELVEQAESEIILASYAIHNGSDIFAPLAARMEALPDLKVTAYLDIPRKYGDKTYDSQIVSGYLHEFRQKHWPSGTREPELLYFKSALEREWRSRASMHAKVVLTDRKVAFISSANLTSAAQQKNLEAGIIVHCEATCRRLCDYFAKLEENGTFSVAI